MSNKDKLKILNFSSLLFEKIYVNLEHKQELYKVDPITEIQKITESYKSLTETEFHDSVLKVYNSVKDYHTNYYFPSPYACYSLILPVSFAKYDTGSIIVSKVDKRKLEGAPEISKITPGDALVKYDDLSPLDYIKERDPYITGSTPDAMLVQGIYDLYWRDLSSNIVPKNNEVTVTLKKSNGLEYQVTLPWFSRAYDSCLNPKDKSLGTKNFLNLTEQKIKERTNYWKKVKNKSLNKGLIDPETSTDLSNLQTTELESLSFKKINSLICYC
jgi:hypothetical protein